MAVQRLISKDLITDDYIPSWNFDKALITDDIIRLCQQKYVKEVLGKDKYNELVTQNDEGTLTDLNKTLLYDYVQPFLAYWILSYVTKTSRAELTSLGVITSQSDFSNPASKDEVGQLVQDFKNRASLMQELLIDWCCENNVTICGTRTTQTGVIFYDTKTKNFNS